MPKDFATRVLKLEMKMEKGAQHVTVPDVENLIDLYARAIEYYSTEQPDRQAYYER